MNVVYVLMMYNIFIMSNEKLFGLFGIYQSEHTAIFLRIINDIHPIDVMLERRCIKFIWTLLHSPNIIGKAVIRSRYSTVCENFRY